MSAYICNPEHFGILAAYAVDNDCVIYPWAVSGVRPNKEGRIINAQNVARNLAKENIRSVAHRYPDCTDWERPGPCLKDDEILEAAAIYAAYFVNNPQRLTPVQILNLCEGYGYQSCETDDYRTTDAELQIDWIVGNAHRKLPGWDGACWSFDKPIPEIEVLYERGFSK